MAGAMRYGYKASAEQFGPRELLSLSLEAERRGLDTVAISDHFQPWRHTGGHGPAALPWLGALVASSQDALIGTSVLTPTLRYRPAVIAQAFATLGCLAPGRVFLGVGTGEGLNETPATGDAFPPIKERRRRLAEAIKLIRALWEGERVDFEGEYYRTQKATIYDRPDAPVPIYVAASGPLAARLAGRAGDGFIVTSGKEPELYTELTAAMEEGAEKAGRDATQIKRMIEIKVSYDRDVDYARDACRPWAALALSSDEKSGIEDPVEMEKAGEAAAGRAHTRFIVADDPDAVVEQIAVYVELGFTELVFHLPGDEQRRQLTAFADDVLPRLRERLGATT
ncbi:MAG: glucose-6-phosphate dehydrogenase (coenzyme-F420) [Solirubrobacteraceae bacterium]